MATELPPHNWPVYGHDWAVDYLRKGMVNHRTRHAYLITGTPSIGKNTFAHAFARALNCTHEDVLARPCGECRSCKLIGSGNHPDMLYAEHDPVSGALKIDAIREVMRLIALKPYDARYRIAIFDDFDMAQPRAQDALLKTLEEAPSHAVLIVMARSTEQIMPTIVSRCQPIFLRPVQTEIIEQVLRARGAGEEQATLLARLSSGRLGWAITSYEDAAALTQRAEALQMLDDAIRGNRASRFAIADELDRAARKDRAVVRGLLELWLTYWRDVLLLALQSPVKPSNSDRHVEIQQIVQRITAEDARAAVNATQKMLNLLIHTNANVRLGLEVMFLAYPGLSR